jgi:hypothetical protein
VRTNLSITDGKCYPAARYKISYFYTLPPAAWSRNIFKRKVKSERGSGFANQIFLSETWTSHEPCSRPDRYCERLAYIAICSPKNILDAELPLAQTTATVRISTTTTAVQLAPTVSSLPRGANGSTRRAGTSQREQALSSNTNHSGSQIQTTG